MIRFPLNSFADHMRAQASKTLEARRQDGLTAAIDTAGGPAGRAQSPAQPWSFSHGAQPPRSPMPSSPFMADRFEGAWHDAAASMGHQAWERACGPDGCVGPW